MLIYTVRYAFDHRRRMHLSFLHAAPQGIHCHFTHIDPRRRFIERHPKR
jgi:hypothetical protein